MIYYNRNYLCALAFKNGIYTVGERHLVAGLKTIPGSCLNIL